MVQPEDSPIVKINGIPILLSQPVSWELKSGVAPVIREFPFDAARHGGAFENLLGRQVDLEFRVLGERMNVQNVWVMRILPGPKEEIRVVQVADWRWRLPYMHILKRYNMRRKVGVWRPESQNADEVVDVLEDISYWKWSLRLEQDKWTPSDVLQDVFAEVNGRLFDGFVQPRLRVLVLQHQERLPIENLEIDDSGDSAIARILDYFPAADLFVNWAGDAIIYDRSDGQEANITQEPWAIADRGRIELAPRTAMRPSSVRVHFTYEVEMRFDYVEATPTTGRTFVEEAHGSAEARERSRLLENVVPLPDHSLVIDGDKIAAGTYVEIKDLLDAWNDLDGDDSFPPSGGRKVSLNELKRAMLPFVDLATALVPPNSPNPDLHLARIAALLENYRRTFRIPERWMDRFLSIQPYRIATIDPKTGARAPGTVYCDYCYLRGSPVMLDAVGEDDTRRAQYASNVRGYPRRPGQGIDLSVPELLKLTEESNVPGKISILDADQGIFRIDFLTSPLKYFSQVLPGNIADADNPTPDIRKDHVNASDAPIFFNASPSGGKLPELKGKWTAAMIFTVVPASPNIGLSQLFTVEIFPNDSGLTQLLSPHARQNLANSRGPPMDIRVPPGVETARVRWADDFADVIMSGIFGFESSSFQRGDDVPTDVEVSELVINLRQNPTGEGGGDTVVQFNELEAIALAHAASIYSEYSDSYEGHADFDFRNAPTVLRGNMEAITLTINPNGEAVMSVSLPSNQPRISMFAFLDAGTRALIMRLAAQPKPAN
jgi:hypothetical protein